jgi:hypothetical protein
MIKGKSKKNPECFPDCHFAGRAVSKYNSAGPGDVEPSGSWADYTEPVTPDGNVFTVSTPGQLAWLAMRVNNDYHSFYNETVVLAPILSCTTIIGSRSAASPRSKGISMGRP